MSKFSNFVLGLVEIILWTVLVGVAACFLVKLVLFVWIYGSIYVEYVAAGNMQAASWWADCCQEVVEEWFFLG